MKTFTNGDVFKTSGKIWFEIHRATVVSNNDSDYVCDFSTSDWKEALQFLEQICKDYPHEDCVLLKKCLGIQRLR